MFIEDSGLVIHFENWEVKRLLNVLKDNVDNSHFDTAKTMIWLKLIDELEYYLKHQNEKENK